MAKFQWQSQENIDAESLKREQELQQLEKHQQDLKRTPKEIQSLGQSLTDGQLESIEQGQIITDMQLESMIQGQLLTDMEIRLLEMEAKANV